jgi:hypothetical protein
MTEEDIENFELCKPFLLPNERVRIALPRNNGFVTLTNRRLIIILNHRGHSKIWLERAFPLDTIHTITPKKKDKVMVDIRKIGDQGELKGKEKKGEMIYFTKSYDLEPFKGSKEDREKTARMFLEGMDVLSQMTKEAQEQIAAQDFIQTHDCSYTNGLSLELDEFKSYMQDDFWKNVPFNDAPILIPGGNLAAIDQEKTITSYRIKTSNAIRYVNRVIPNALLSKLSWDWHSRTTSNYNLTWKVYNEKKQIIEINKDGSPKVEGVIFSILDRDYTKERSELIGKTPALQPGVDPWTEPMVNWPWIIADAYFQKMEKLIPASIGWKENEKPRLWY